jgi:protein phosphatase PTC2/3
MAIRFLMQFTGRFALTRGLGNLEFEKNPSLIPEDQIMTANPDVLVHSVSKEDEFLVLASDGE